MVKHELNGFAPDTTCADTALPIPGDGSRETNGGWIREAEQRGVGDLFTLGLERTVERGVSVAMEIDPNG